MIPRFAIVAVLAALVFLSKLPVLSVPFYWDEMAWVSQAHWLAQGSLLRALPGLRGASAFFGHTPGLHLALAALAQVFGFSIVLAHLIPVTFAAVGVVFTYLLGRALFDARAGVLAALGLFLSPIYFAQAGMFLGDLPVAALGVASVYFGVRGWYWRFVACASCMVLLKETAIAVVVAVLLYRLLTGGSIAERARELVTWSVPLIVVGLFASWQKLMTGRWFFIYPQHWTVDLFVPTPAMVRYQLAEITEWLFVDQGRWVFTAAIALNLIRHRAARRRPELWLLALITLLSGYAFAVMYLLPRYLLPALPMVYVLGAWSLLELFETPAAKATAATVAVVFMIWTLTHQPLVGNAEFNPRYLDVVAVHQEMDAFVAAEHPNARVLTAWPHTQELSQPELGYVRQRVHVVPFNGGSMAPRAPNARLDDRGADLILASIVLPADGMTDLRSEAIRNGWRLLRRLENGPAVSELYERGP